MLAEHLSNGRSVALGVEAPLYLPIASDEQQINSQRPGEHNRSWSASSGAAVAALGVHQLAYILKGIGGRVSRTEFDIGFELPLADAERPMLMIWEAFVSGKAKATGEAAGHIADAQLAVDTFKQRIDGHGTITSNLDDDAVAVVNLAGAAILAAGLSDDATLVRKPCIVVKPEALSA